MVHLPSEQPVLLRFREKAHDAYSQYQLGTINTPGSAGKMHEGVKREEDGQDELSILGGRTRFVATRQSPQPTSSPHSSSSRTFSPSRSPSVLNPERGTPEMSMIDPDPLGGPQQYDSLMNYFSGVPGSGAPSFPEYFSQSHPETLAQQFTSSFNPPAPQVPEPTPVPYPTQALDSSMFFAPLSGSYSLTSGGDVPSYGVPLADSPRTDDAWTSFMQESGILVPGF